MPRRAGVPNKISREVREKFQQLLEGQMEQLERDFQSLTAKDRINFMLQLAKFVVPTLKATEMEIVQADSEPVDFNELIKKIRKDESKNENSAS